MTSRSMKRRARDLKIINHIRTDMQNGFLDVSEFDSPLYQDLTEEDYEVGDQLITKYSKSLEQRYERYLHG